MKELRPEGPQISLNVARLIRGRGDRRVPRGRGFKLALQVHDELPLESYAGLEEVSCPSCSS